MAHNNTNAKNPYTKFLLGGIIGVNAAVFAAWRYAKKWDVTFVEEYLRKEKLDNISNFSVNITPRLLYDSPSLAKKEFEKEASFLVKHFCFAIKNVTAGRWWTLLSHSVSHINIAHIANNMIGLWTFGVEVGKVVGPVQTAVIYISFRFFLFFLLFHFRFFSPPFAQFVF